VILTVAYFLLQPLSQAASGRQTNFADEVSAKVASTWFELLYDVVKAEKTPPPPASRAYGVAAMALYEALVGGNSDNRSLAGQLNGLNESKHD
jgi:hypothetical protein